MMSQPSGPSDVLLHSLPAVPSEPAKSYVSNMIITYYVLSTREGNVFKGLYPSVYKGRGMVYPVLVLWGRGYVVSWSCPDLVRRGQAGELGVPGDLPRLGLVCRVGEGRGTMIR